MAFKFKSRFNYSNRAIRAMSLETRQRLYDQEKNELFNQVRHLPGDEVAEAHRKLAEKWKV